MEAALSRAQGGPEDRGWSVSNSVVQYPLSVCFLLFHLAGAFPSQANAVCNPVLPQTPPCPPAHDSL